MNEKMVLTEDQFYDLLGFLITSAQLTLIEPDDYPVLRLVDASSRLIKSVIESGQVQDEGLLEELRTKLDECVEVVGIDESKLGLELDNAVLLMAKATIEHSRK